MMESANVLVLLFGLLGKYFLADIGLLACGRCWLYGFATPQESVPMRSVLATYAGLILLIMLSFWLGAIFTFRLIFITHGLSATGFISAPSYAFAGVTFPLYCYQWQCSALVRCPATHPLSKTAHCTITDASACCCVITNRLWSGYCHDDCDEARPLLLTKRALVHPERWGALMSLSPKDHLSSTTSDSTKQSSTPSFLGSFYRPLRTSFLIKVCYYSYWLPYYLWLLLSLAVFDRSGQPCTCWYHW